MTLEDVGATVESTGITYATSSAAAKTEQDPLDTFNSIKALIIKSADIVDAYYDATSYRMQSTYVAQSTFGEYTEKTDKVVTETAESTKEMYTNVQNISSNVAGIQEQLRDTDGYIKRGIIGYADDGTPIIGIEIGQTVKDENDEDVFKQYARFTSDQLTFYDQNGDDVAYISDNTLLITNVEIPWRGSLFRLGGFRDEVQSGGDIVTRWVGV